MKMNKYIETWYIAFITNKLHYKESVNEQSMANQILLLRYLHFIIGPYWYHLLLMALP